MNTTFPFPPRNNHLRLRNAIGTNQKDNKARASARRPSGWFNRGLAKIITATKTVGLFWDMEISLG